MHSTTPNKLPSKRTSTFALCSADSRRKSEAVGGGSGCAKTGADHGRDEDGGDGGLIAELRQLFSCVAKSGASQDDRFAGIVREPGGEAVDGGIITRHQI